MTLVKSLHLSEDQFHYLQEGAPTPCCLSDMWGEQAEPAVRGTPERAMADQRGPCCREQGTQLLYAAAGALSCLGHFYHHMPPPMTPMEIVQS